MNKTSNTGRFDYFEAFSRQAAYAQEIALNLHSAILAGELGSLDLMKALHVVENDADEVNHRIQERLLRDFVVPMERGGMAELAHALDDVCDSVEQISIVAYTRKASSVESIASSGVRELVDHLGKGAQSLCSAVDLLRAFDKKGGEIKRHCIEVQTHESAADEVYIESVRRLHEDGSLADRDLRIACELLDAAEAAVDTLEAAAERLESIVAENV